MNLNHGLLPTATSEEGSHSLRCVLYTIQIMQSWLCAKFCALDLQGEFKHGAYYSECVVSLDFTMILW